MICHQGYDFTDKGFTKKFSNNGLNHEVCLGRSLSLKTQAVTQPKLGAALEPLWPVQPVVFVGTAFEMVKCTGVTDLHADLALTLRAITQHGLTKGCGAQSAEATATFVHATRRCVF